jgi:hypothetical protein
MVARWKEKGWRNRGKGKSGSRELLNKSFYSEGEKVLPGCAARDDCGKQDHPYVTRSIA